MPLRRSLPVLHQALEWAQDLVGGPFHQHRASGQDTVPPVAAAACFLGGGRRLLARRARRRHGEP
ncbi:hypothetical protein ACWZEH_16480 [Streptomyces sp. QTS137]